MRATTCFYLFQTSAYLMLQISVVHAELPPHLDPGPLGRSIYSIQDELRFPGRGGPPDLPQKLAAKRREAIDYTHRHLHEPLGRFTWQIPVSSLYGWSLLFEQRTYPESEQDLRALFDLLRRVPACNKEPAVMVLSQIMRRFGEHWSQTGYFPQSVLLLDEIEAWARVEPAALRTWQINTGMLQTRVLMNEHLFAPEQRPSLRKSRHHRLMELLADTSLPLSYRNRVTAQWANALYLNGYEEQAHQLMKQWWQQQEGAVTESSFFTIWLKILAYGQPGSEMAGRLLEHINTLPLEQMRPAERAGFEQAAAYYYNALQLPDYEIRRLRHLQVQTFTGERDQIRETFMNMQARNEAEGNRAR